MSNNIKLKVGQKYKDRNGDVWLITAKSRDFYPFNARDVKDPSRSRTFLETGRFDMEEEGIYDLVELVEDTPIQTKLKVGQRYKDREGNTWTVQEHVDTWGFACTKPDNHCFRREVFSADGRSTLGVVQHPFDLIELIEGMPERKKEETVMSKIDPKFKVGQKWRTRDGEKVVLIESVKQGYRYAIEGIYAHDGSIASRDIHGKWCDDGSTHPKDLVELVEDAPTPEAQEEKAPAVEKHILEGVQVGQKVRRANGEIGEVVAVKSCNTARVWWPRIGCIYHLADGSANSFPQYTIVALVPSGEGQEAVTHGDNKEETTDTPSESPSPIKNKYDFYPPGAVEYAEDVKLGDRVMVRHFQVWCEGYVVGIMDDGAVLSVLNRETGLDTQIQAGEEVVVVKKNNFPLMLPTQRWRTRGGRVVTLEHDTRDAGDLTTVEEDEEGLHSSYSENVPFIRCDPDWDLVECVSQQKTLFLSSSLEVYQVDDNIVMRQPQNKSFFVFGTGDREALMNGFESAASACYGFPTCLIARSLLAGMNK